MTKPLENLVTRLCRCGEEITGPRYNLGHKNCLACGEIEARKEILAKGDRVSPDGNKQGYSYQGAPEAAKRNILQAGKKNATFVHEIPTGSYTDCLAERRSRAKANLGPIIGRCHVGSDPRTIYANQPLPAGATRIVYFARRRG